MTRIEDPVMHILKRAAENKAVVLDKLAVQQTAAALMNASTTIKTLQGRIEELEKAEEERPNPKTRRGRKIKETK